MTEVEAPEVAAAEMLVSTEESRAPIEQREAPEEEAAAVESSADGEIPPLSSDHKRKLQTLDPNVQDEAPHKKQVSSPAPAATEAPSLPIDEAAADANPALRDGEEINGSGVYASEIGAAVTEETPQEAQEIVAETHLVGTTTVASDAKIDAKLPVLEGIADGSAEDEGQGMEKTEPSAVGNGQHPQHAPENPPTVIPTTGQQPPPSSRKIEIPHNKVGVLIGKAGNTIKYLQSNSGARIQIARDAEADPHSSTRPVELIGTPENINKAEQLIRDVIAEADAGGSPALVARGFGTVQSGGEHIEIPVPNEKAGLIIGKGGETIKNLQTKSGARIQLIPLHVPPGDTSKDRVVRITGNLRQIESAREMVKEVMNQTPLRPSPLSGKYSQQSFRPRGPATPPQWGPRATVPSQQMTGYDYSQRGMQYPTQPTQYPQPYGGGYSQHPPPTSNISTGCDQRPAAPAQATLQNGGYDYYGQGAPAAEIHSSNMMSAPAPASVAPAPMNYNYVQSQTPGYGHPQAPTAQSGPTQQNYGHGYNEPRYDQAPPSQPVYGQQPSSQPGVYGQQSSAPQSSYSQQQSYGNPAYTTTAQGQVPSSYGQTGPPQQSYPYGSSAPTHPTPYGQPYGHIQGTVDGYTQTSSASYPPQQGQPAPGYGQGEQSMPAYTQPGLQSGSYVQPQSQPSYSDQAAASNVNYGYQGGSAAPISGYGGTQMSGSQLGYVQQQPLSTPSGYYEQAAVPPLSAPGNNTMSLPPQLGYGGQY